MIKIYLTISNVILNSMILKIIILINSIKKALKIDKDIYIVTIHEYIDIIYLMIDSFEMFTVLIAVSTAISELLSLI